MATHIDVCALPFTLRHLYILMFENKVKQLCSLYFPLWFNPVTSAPAPWADPHYPNPSPLNLSCSTSSFSDSLSPDLELHHCHQPRGRSPPWGGSAVPQSPWWSTPAFLCCHGSVTTEQSLMGAWPHCLTNTHRISCIPRYDCTLYIQQFICFC